MGGCSAVPAAARSAKASTAGSGTRPVPQPCRKTGQAPSRCAAPTTCAMPRCRCGWPRRPAAEIAARAGHSVRVLLTIYAHGIPGCDQIASQQIEEALRPSQWPPAGPQESAQIPGILSVMRPCHSWTQRDTTGPETSAQIRLDGCDLRKYRSGKPVPWITDPDSRSRAPRSPEPLTRADLAHHWSTATGNGLPNRSFSAIEPRTQVRVNGSDLGFRVAGVGFEPT